jgi:hypothetical protein
MGINVGVTTVSYWNNYFLKLTYNITYAHMSWFFLFGFKHINLFALVDKKNSSFAIPLCPIHKGPRTGFPFCKFLWKTKGRRNEFTPLFYLRGRIDGNGQEKFLAHICVVMVSDIANTIKKLLSPCQLHILGFILYHPCICGQYFMFCEQEVSIGRALLYPQLLLPYS